LHSTKKKKEKIAIEPLFKDVSTSPVD